MLFLKKLYYGNKDKVKALVLYTAKVLYASALVSAFGYGILYYVFMV